MLHENKTQTNTSVVNNLSKFILVMHYNNMLNLLTKFHVFLIAFRVANVKIRINQSLSKFAIRAMQDIKYR